MSQMDRGIENMKIAVLGWGSLIWSPRELKIKGEWHDVGPSLPIEFARVSSDGRLTLIITPDVKKIYTLWANMDIDSLEEGIKNLSKREKTSKENIGFIDIANGNHRSNVIPDIVDEITQWVQENNIDAVIWTDLEPNFEKETQTEFTEENVIKYLQDLPHEDKRKAQEYIRKAPQQTRTKMREVIENEFGWTFTWDMFNCAEGNHECSQLWVVQGYLRKEPSQGPEGETICFSRDFLCKEHLIKLFNQIFNNYENIEIVEFSIELLSKCKNLIYKEEEDIFIERIKDYWLHTLNPFPTALSQTDCSPYEFFMLLAYGLGDEDSAKRFSEGVLFEEDWTNKGTGKLKYVLNNIDPPDISKK